MDPVIQKPSVYEGIDDRFAAHLYHQIIPHPLLPHKTLQSVEELSFSQLQLHQRGLLFVEFHFKIYIL